MNNDIISHYSTWVLRTWALSIQYSAQELVIISPENKSLQ